MPSTRSLSLTFLPTLTVVRENGPEPGAICSRVAPTFLRIGSFEIINPPPSEMVFSFMGGGGLDFEKKPEWDALRQLAEAVKVRMGLKEGAGAREIVREISRRNALTVAGWQSFGFCAGVLNTDNVSSASPIVFPARS